MPRTEGDRQVPYYPAFLDLVRKRAVVIGGGEIATQKVTGLLPCGLAAIIVIAPAVSERIAVSVAGNDYVTWHARAYAPGDLAGADLAFAATDDRAANAVVAAEARERCIPVLAVDDIPYCDFIAPALVQRGDLTIAISTGGRSPAMASHVRRYLERVFPPAWGDLLAISAAVRDGLGLRRREIAPEQWQAALNHEVKRLVWQGDREGATALLHRKLTDTLVEGPPA